MVMKFEYTNHCTCEEYNEEADEYLPTDYCFGDCWENQIQDFTNITEGLFDKNETNWWKVQGLRLWNGDVAGFFYAKDVIELIRGMTVRSEWIMRGEVFDDRIEYSLSHHDAPMGSSSVLTIISEEQRKQLGLY